MVDLRDDTGSSVVETVVLIPLLMLVLLITVAVGRLVNARMLVNDAASEAARSASLARGPALAGAAAHIEIDRILGKAPASCRTRDVVVDTKAFRPGGTVKVVVVCHTDLGDLAGLRFVSLNTSISSSSVSPVDVFRQATR